MGGMLVDLFWGTLFLGGLCFCGSRSRVRGTLVRQVHSWPNCREMNWRIEWDAGWLSDSYTYTVICCTIQLKSLHFFLANTVSHVFDKPLTCVDNIQWYLRLLTCRQRTTQWHRHCFMLFPAASLIAVRVTSDLRLLLITVIASGLLMATLAHYYIQDDSVDMTTRQFLYDTWIARRVKWLDRLGQLQSERKITFIVFMTILLDYPPWN